MAELTPETRLQPSLLDRLTDDHPESRVESREARVLNVDQLRDMVLRDLRWLLNCENFESAHDLASYPNVASSTLNFGVPALSGKTSSGTDIAKLQERMRQAIIQFEPRILADTVSVNVLYHEVEMSENSLMFEIEGELWAQPIPLRLFLQTTVDLETGEVDLVRLD